MPLHAAPLAACRATLGAHAAAAHSQAAPLPCRPAAPNRCTRPQVALYRSLLPRTLGALPGGGLAGGSVLEVSDHEQRLTAHLLLEQRVSRRLGGGGGWAGGAGGAGGACASASL